jgi:hypothetical protein
MIAQGKGAKRVPPWEPVSLNNFLPLLPRREERAGERRVFLFRSCADLLFPSQIHELQRGGFLVGARHANNLGVRAGLD